jgi:hypothetical protein
MGRQRSAIALVLSLLSVVAPCAYAQSSANPLTSPALARGTLCDRTHYLIVQGSINFDDVIGGRIEGNRFRTDVHIDDKGSQCFIYESGRADIRTFQCRIFADRTGDLGEARLLVRSIENQLTRCLTRENRFGFIRFGQSEPRYYVSRRSDDDISFNDWFHNQTVTVRIKYLQGDEPYIELSIRGEN